MSATVGAPLSATELPAEVRAGPRGQPADAASAAAHTLSHDERAAAGRALRDKFPRTQHATWKKSETRTDPIDLLRASDADRLPDLVPIRYGRMLQSPFTFYRGAAGGDGRRPGRNARRPASACRPAATAT